jgi:hypothetical protein
MKQLFLVMTATIIMASLHTKAFSAPAVKAKDGSAVNYLAVMANRDCPSIKIDKQFNDDDWHGLLNPELRGRLSESQVKEALTAAVLNDKAIIAKYFRPDVYPINLIVRRQLTWVDGKDPDRVTIDPQTGQEIVEPQNVNAFILSEEEALRVVKSLKRIKVQNFWDGDDYVSMRYNGNRSESKTKPPNPPKDWIWAVDGKIEYPAFRDSCLNGIRPSPYAKRPPKKNEENDQVIAVQPKSYQQTHQQTYQMPTDRGGNINTNTMTTNVYNTGGGGQQPVVYEPQKKGNGFAFAAGVGLGWILKTIIDPYGRSQQVLYQAPQNYQLGRNEQWWYEGQNYYGDRGGNYYPPQPQGPRNYNNSQANPQMPLTPQQIIDREREEIRWREQQMYGRR